MGKAVTPKQTLTDRKIRSLKATGARYELRDMLVPGFCLRVSEKGARTFVLKTRYPGSANPTRRALGEYGVLSLDDAREKARKWIRLIKTGIDPALVEQRERMAAIRKQENSFGSVAEDWFRDKLPGERKGREVERDIRSQFMPLWEKRPIADIGELDVLSVINAKKRTAPAQARNLLGDLKRLFSWAIDQRCYGLTVSPCDHLKPAKVIGRKPTGRRILTDDEIFALWRAAGRTPYPHGPVYRLLMLTALRLNEAADASKSEFDPRNGIWLIPAERMKGTKGEAKAHAVPLTDAIKALLDELPVFKKGPFIFTTTHGKSPIWISSWVKARIDKRMLLTLRALARRRGDDPASVTLPRWVNHDIRRTVRSGLSRLKVPEEVREAVLAHARPGIKGTYDHHDYLDEKREALQLWERRLRDIVNPITSNVVRLHAMA
jgi:integrase